MTQLSFVLFILMTSLGQIIVLFLIGKTLVNLRTRLTAAFLGTISPFDVVFASTMTIDIPAVFAMSLSFYFFRLFLVINDCPPYRYDNRGGLNITVRRSKYEK